MSGKPTVAERLTETHIEEIETILDDADYSACPVPAQKQVQRFFFDSLVALVRDSRNGGRRPGPKPTIVRHQRPRSWKEFLFQFGFRFPWVAMVLGIIFLILMANGKGWISILPRGDTHDPIQSVEYSSGGSLPRPGLDIEDVAVSTLGNE